MQPSISFGRADASLASISAHLAELGSSIYSKHDLLRLLRANRKKWRVPSSIKAATFIEILLEQAQVEQITLTSPYTQITRFAYGDISPFALALSIDRFAYLSHGSAAFLNGLSDDIQQIIYLNKEQSEKPRPDGEITQEGIDNAFHRLQRRSKNVFQYSGYALIMVNGKNTGQLQVREIEGPNAESLRVTGLERTLIDITVRPGYAGGVAKVMAAYKRAAPKISLQVLYRTLKRLDYKYPYHQAIGFYLSKAGFDDSQLSSFLALGTRFKFYLDYGLLNPRFDRKWNIFH